MPEPGDGIERRTLTAGAFYGRRIPRTCALADTLRAKLCERRLRLLEAVQPHRGEDLRRLRELDLAIVDDLEQVAPGVVDVQCGRRRDVDPRCEGRRARPSGGR